METVWKKAGAFKKYGDGMNHLSVTMYHSLTNQINKPYDVAGASWEKSENIFLKEEMLSRSDWSHHCCFLTNVFYCFSAEQSLWTPPLLSHLN